MRASFLGPIISASCLALLGATLWADEPPNTPEATPSDAGDEAEAAEPPVSFFHDVLPILQQRCQGCHQPAKANGQLVLTDYAGLMKGGQTDPAIVPGDPEDSLLIFNTAGPMPIMPPEPPYLTQEQVETLRRWIAQGAHDDTPAGATDPIDPDHPPVYTLPPVISALAYSPDGGLLAVSGYHEVLLHKADGSGLAARLVGQAERIESLAFSPDGKLLAAAAGSPARFGEVQIWNVETGKMKLAHRATYDTVYGVSFSPDGKHVAFGCADNSLRVITADTGQEVLRFDNHSDWVFDTTFSLDGKHVVSVSRDRAIKLVVLESGQFVDDVNKHTSPYAAVARRPGKDEIVVAGDDGIARHYQIFRTKARNAVNDDFNLIRALERQPAPLADVCWSPDGNQILTGCLDGKARLYDAADGKRLAELAAGQGAVFAVAYRPDGKEVAVGGLDGTVRFYNPAGGKLLREFIPVPTGEQVAETSGG